MSSFPHLATVRCWQFMLTLPTRRGGLIERADYTRFGRPLTLHQGFHFSSQPCAISTVHS